MDGAGGEWIHMLLSTGDQQRIYYLSASFWQPTSSFTAVELYRDIIATDTFFVGETLESVGSHDYVYPSYTVGYAYSMTSSKGLSKERTAEAKCLDLSYHLISQNHA